MSAELELLEKCVRLAATGLISVIATAALNYVKTVTQSINALNVSVAQLLERSVSLEKTLESLSARLERLETKKEN